MKIALVQVASPATETVTNRRTRVGTMVCSAFGADLVVLPELWPSGYFAFDRYEAEAETIDGPTVAAGAEWARALGCHLQLGSLVVRGENGELWNTSVLLDPTGSVVHAYRKSHVFGYRSLKAQLLTPGTETAVAQTALGAVSGTTYYDLRFPELWRQLVDAEAELVLVPGCPGRALASAHDMPSHRGTGAGRRLQCRGRTGWHCAGWPQPGRGPLGQRPSRGR